MKRLILAVLLALTAFSGVAAAGDDSATGPNSIQTE